MRKILSLLAALAVAIGAFPAIAQSCNPYKETLPVADGPVHSAIKHGNVLYMGGDFLNVGKPIGSSLAISASTGANIPNFPKTEGLIRTVISDGAGGYFIGGSFNKVGGHTLNRLAHIKADLSVDLSFVINPNFEVDALHLENGTLFFGGKFWQVNGVSRNFLASCNATTGELSDWAPSNNGQVTSFSSYNGKLFVGGGFTSMESQTRLRLACFDLTTLQLTSWDAGVNGNISSVEATPSGVFVAGNFNEANALPRIRVAKFNNDATLNDWNPSPNGFVRVLKVHNGTAYIGGDFNFIGGEVREKVAAIDTATGTATAWSIIPNGNIYQFAFHGNNMHILGLFSEINGVARTEYAEIDLTTNTVTNKKVKVNSLPNMVFSDGNRIYFVGSFSLQDNVSRTRLAAYDLSTQQFTSWSPNPSDIVRKMVIKDNILYVGGKFQRFNSTNRNGLASFDLNNGNLTTWNPNVGGGSGDVRDLLIHSTDLYVAGANINFVGGQDINSNLFKFDLSTQTLSSWRPAVGSDVNALAINKDTLFLAGSFGNASSMSRSRFAMYNINTGNILQQFLQISGNVNALAIDNNKLYIGGAFIFVTGINGGTKFNVACLDLNGLKFTSLYTPTNEPVYSLAAKDGVLYIGGGFTTVSGVSRSKVAAVNAEDGSLLSWNPEIDLDVYQIIPSEDEVLLMGNFNSSGGNYSKGIMAAHSPVPKVQAASTSFCPFTTVTLTAQNVGYSNPSYLWSNGATTQSIEVGTAGIYSVRVISGSCTSAISKPIVITQAVCPSNYVWNGTGSWTSAANWTPAFVPTPNSNITVQSGTLTVNGNYAINNLTVNGGSNLFIGGGSVLNIAGNAIVNGGSNANGGGEINLNGTGNQLLSSAGAGAWNIGTLRVSNNSGTVTLNRQLLIWRELILGNGSIFDLNGRSLTLKANATSRVTANLNMIAGNAQLLNTSGFWCEVAYPKSPAGSGGSWVQTAPPVQGQQVRSLHQKGNFPSIESYNAAIPASGSFYWFSNSFTTHPTNDGFYKPSDSTEAWPLGKGIRAWIRKVPADNGAFGYKGAPFTGNSFVINNLDYCTNNCAISDPNGLNLIGNPLAATINWDLLTRNHVEDALYQFNGNTNAYGTFINGVGVNGGRKEIATGQGFFVHALQAGASITVPQTAVVPASTFAIFRSGTTEDLLRININLGDSSVDEMAIRLKDGATHNFDSRYDGRKMTGSGINIASIAEDGRRLSVDARPLTTGMIRIPLVMSRMNNLRNEELVFTGLESFNGKQVYLNHPSFDAPVQLTEGQRFTVSPAYATGLEVIINNSPQAIEGQLSNTFSLYPNPATENLTVSGINSGTVVSVLTVQGKEIIRQTLGAEGSLSVKALPQGLYFVEINGIKKTFVKQ